ncbi:unnamed protein product [Spirodela intermedia]|uniref:Uncharacterized protein n=1 Tax=Spirodela intermedia TaxID=51605 RepID=A0A7I8IDR9_SPIIN|nr:unnamed protein product [Spirodela intermedia]CAA6655967.1 unnamed protein product [Spirodela intermedia]
MAEEGARSTGKVKWFNGTKGFGFITPDDGGEELFVHQSSIKSAGFRTLAADETVEYCVSEGDDGRIKAVDVTGPGGAPVEGQAQRESSWGGGGGGGFRRGYGDGGYGGFGGGRNGRGGGGYGGEEGHLARDCAQGGGGYGRGATGRFGSGGGSRIGGGGGGMKCYNCGEEGHFVRDCTIAMK